jgi:hypothetical protein
MLKWENNTLSHEEAKLRSTIAAQPTAYQPPLPCSPPPALIPAFVSLHSTSEKDLDELSLKFNQCPSLDEGPSTPSQVVRSATVGCDLARNLANFGSINEDCSAKNIKYGNLLIKIKHDKKESNHHVE